MTMVSLAEVARLDELRQARGLSETARERIEVAGGVAARGEPGTPENNAVGLGFAGEVREADVSRLRAFHEAGGVEPRVEVSPYAHASLLARLVEAGYSPRAFEVVFFRALSAREQVGACHPPPSGLVVRAVNAGDEGELLGAARTLVSGFVPEGTAEVETHVDVAARWMRHPRTIGVAAWLDGAMVGASAMEVAGEVGALFGASVVPAARGRGVQQAMLAFRLNLAASRGATIATIASRPGEGTERNVRRMGFQVAQVKTIMVRPGPGLTPLLLA